MDLMLIASIDTVDIPFIDIDRALSENLGDNSAVFTFTFN